MTSSNAAPFIAARDFSAALPRRLRHRLSATSPGRNSIASIGRSTISTRWRAAMDSQRCGWPRRMPATSGSPFAQLSERSNRVANYFRRLGVRRGDRILLMLGNVVALWECMLAAMKLGAVIIPATTLLTQERSARPFCARPRPPCHRRRRCRGQVRRLAGGLFAASSSANRCADGCLSTTPVQKLPRHSARTARRRPTTRCCFISPLERRRRLSSCCTAIRAILSDIFRRCTGSASAPGDVHMNISSPGWAKHAWSCFFAPWNAQATIFIANQKRFNARRSARHRVRCGVTTFCAPPTVWRMLIQENLWRLESTHAGADRCR